MPKGILIFNPLADRLKVIGEMRMTPLMKIKKLLDQFKTEGETCNIYESTETAKILFGESKIVSIKIVDKKFHFVKFIAKNGNFFLSEETEIYLNSADAFIAKFHFDKVHPEKELKTVKVA